MFDFSKLFHYNYIFEYIPQWQHRISWINWLIYGIILVLGIILFLINKFTREKYFFLKKLKDKIFPLTNTIGLVGILFTFFRYQAIPYLSSRFLVYSLVGAAVIWLGFILWYFGKNYPGDKLAAEIIFRKKRYLPHKNKKKK